MTIHTRMDDADRRNRLDDMAQGVLSTAMDRPDGPLKVSGRAPYAHEVQPEGMLHGVFVRAPRIGRVVSLDDAAARAMDGVETVVTDDRLLRNPAQGTANEAPVQGPREVFYVGQPIALVVARTFETARAAALSVGVEIADAERAPVAPQDYDSPDKKQSSQGDLDAAMRDAAVTVDRMYTTPAHSSAPMEPHAAIAEWDGDRLTLRGSLQMLKFNRNELADSLGIDPKNLRILSPYVGGGFGSKLGVAPEAVAAAIAAQETGRPVGVALSRQQVFEATMRRSETRQRVRLAADAEGRLTGIGHDAWVSNLPDESYSEPVTQATPFTYRGENRVIGHHVARVSRTCAGSVRAPGEAVGITVFEIAMDELAHAAGIDPVELRRRNIPDRDPTKDIPFSSNMLAQALDAGAAAFGWDDSRPAPGSRREGEWMIGQGMASAVRVNNLAEAKARVTLNPDGTALVETDMTDIGTGSYAILTQIAAEMLGLPPERVEVRLGDTDLPPGSGSGGSVGASSSGSAVFLACQGVRERLAEAMGVAETDLTLKDGQAIADNRSTPLGDVIDGPVEALGHIEPGKTSKAVRQATWGAYFAEVAVNSVTGETRVRRMHGTFAAGRILNAKTARSQCLGGMTFGIGMALTEELMHDARDGHVVNRDLAEYHIPVNADVPQITVELLMEERDPWTNPMQAKGIGELGICGAAAAIVNAIHQATGVRVRDLPATLDKVMAGLED
ncbi:xanthine dehydrogenase family protein molybdopterin-binding subunit [Jannaschia rubra]|uniref:Xanthine dehydrogenase molybdenum-binding subunit n=1 Tax=Jannaschia rubra TaxID=282197 RepID=A0A0M6XR71_9RHOB|nr:xanthine dehydrogenase family protein molybdopterin-binding subunit [Jannaschia rubra]CTQ32665.1 Xanthine dehydrogenase molybdenum-binding subunit [Jannaschia rubra]SFF87026.1 xanthine dehydrogenase, molybdenum binding subunit apoprotein [Jannaschia rubra]